MSPRFRVAASVVVFAAVLNAGPALAVEARALSVHSAGDLPDRRRDRGGGDHGAGDARPGAVPGPPDLDFYTVLPADGCDAPVYP